MKEHFYQKITSAMIPALLNNYDDNYDYELMNEPRLNKFLRGADKIFQGFLSLVGKKHRAKIFLEHQSFYLDNLEGFRLLFDSLVDDESKDRLIELLAFKVFGPTRVKLSLNNDVYWQERRAVKQCQLDEVVEVRKFRSALSLFNLEFYGYDLKLFFVSNGVYVDFVLQQYNYNDLVCVDDGDVVIDAGGCWGDTALYFASQKAKDVYVYEFIPSNLKVFQKNLDLNPQYKERIHIVNRPVWSESNVVLSYDDRGPGSQVAEAGKYQGEVETLSIDDLVLQRELSSLDFIKMDIEGAEMAALKGAEKSIKRFKPKLAISVYHKPDDMIVIPEYILSLNPDYELYLDYYTIIGYEIILYAIDKHAK